jgi:hypothetical protein
MELDVISQDLTRVEMYHAQMPEHSNILMRGGDGMVADGRSHGGSVIWVVGCVSFSSKQGCDTILAGFLCFKFLRSDHNSYPLMVQQWYRRHDSELLL